MEMTRDFWKGKTVFVTGHTGFKGSWLVLWLNRLGARVTGYALQPPTSPSLFSLAGIAQTTTSLEADVRDLGQLSLEIQRSQPDVVFHLAAQSLVRQSYQEPVETYATNIMGTVNLLESVRHCPSVKSTIVVTSDKCYENKEWFWAYREDEPMGGSDPYSSSKGCAELVTAAYRKSFFSGASGGNTLSGLASARAGNVIGGGDWATDRLIPDILKSFSERRPVLIRSPKAVRPWQHVLEPLAGYLELAEKLWSDADKFAGSWNFGPGEDDVKPVSWIVERLKNDWGEGSEWQLDVGPRPHEAAYLKLDCSKARALLNWAPVLNLEIALKWTVEWYRGYLDGKNMRQVTEAQIERYQDRSA
jgi:CDP-glucose 4,6-dehydratase